MSVEKYELGGPRANKYLQPDGSITTKSGTVILPPDLERAKKYELAGARVNKWLMPDGSITTDPGGGGGVGEETDPIWTAEKGNYALKADLLTRDIAENYHTILLANVGESTPANLITFTATRTGSYRFFLSAWIHRVGGTNGIGVLNLELTVNGAPVSSIDFEIFRDLNTNKSTTTAKCVDLNVDDVVELNGSYTASGLETLTIDDIIMSMDIINHEED